jgi:hypothetical protein
MIRSKNWRKKVLEKVEVVKDNTNNKESEVVEKRNKNRCIKQEFESNLSETPEFNCEKTYSRTKNKRVNWFCVQRWFIDGIRKNNPDWLVIDNKKTENWTERKQTWWTWAEKNCAQRLLEHYGEDVVKKTVEWFCNNWQGMVDESDGRLSGAPSVKLLWASRDRIFVDAKLGYVPGKKRKKVKKHMVGEYDPELDGSKKVGW